MFEMYIESFGKKLRCGYTTGSCATAAAKAATYALFNGKSLDYVNILTPNNINIEIEVHETNFYEDYVECLVRKDGGDDIDVTDGILIGARVKKANEFSIDGGEGVGRVYADGLSIKKGEAAINPVPRLMIEKVVKEISENERFEVAVEIFVPDGELVAKKTFNSRLNILNGISILGTTGIVYPMSEEALKASIALEISQKILYSKEIILVFGHMGEKFAKNLGYDEKKMVIMSNFVGFALETCVNKGATRVTIIGHIGKMCKIAYGCFNTHSKVCGVRLEVIALEMALLGYDMEFVKRILNEKTTDGAVNTLGKGNEKLYQNIAKKIKSSAATYIHGEVDIDVLVYKGTVDSEILAKA